MAISVTSPSLFAELYVNKIVASHGINFLVRLLSMASLKYIVNLEYLLVQLSNMFIIYLLTAWPGCVS